MRAAVFSDVHGNALALERVLQDADRCGVDEHWIAGDLVAHGPRPADTIRLLMGLPGLACVRGNTDRYVLTGELSAMIPTSEIKTLMEASRSFGWTLASINAAGGYDWLSALPLEQRMPLPSGDRVLIVHAAPGLDDGPGLYPELTDQELLEAGVAQAHADLIFVGHTHVPMDRIVGGTRVINLGSISNPTTPERRAMWTLLTADTTGYTLEPRFCSYDTEKVCSELDNERHPSTEWLKSMLRTRGLNRPR